MYSATFIFDKKQYDDAFYALDAAIAEAAKQTDGYVGEESWQNAETGRVQYVWLGDLQRLQTLINPPINSKPRRSKPIGLLAAKLSLPKSSAPMATAQLRTWQPNLNQASK